MARYVCWRRDGDVAKVFVLWIVPHATAGEVKTINFHTQLLINLHVFRSGSLPKDIKRAKTRIVICSPGSVLDSTFRKKSIHAVPLEGGILEWQEFQSTAIAGPEIPNTMQFDAIAKVRSPGKFVAAL